MLTAKKVERTRKPGRYRDGLVKGLLLQISKSGAKSWVLRYERHGQEHMLGLGSVSDFNLKEARERARAKRQLLADGVDPLQQKRAAQAAARLAAAKVLSFREAAERYAAQHEVKWSNEQWRLQFLSSLRIHVFPLLGDMDIAAIDTPAVLQVLSPIWTKISVTADRIRNRIEAIIDWAVVCGHRPAGTNPARWSGHLVEVLPSPKDVAPVEHLATMLYSEVPVFMQTLREQEGVVARALEFVIYTAARSGEVYRAKWDEIDFETATWTRPAAHMKSRLEHRVPLSPQAIELLRKLPHEDGNDHIFVGSKSGAGMHTMAMINLLHDLREGLTVHGFRASFKTWAKEKATSFAWDVSEHALAHAVGGQTERSYSKSTMFEKRRRMMQQWSKFVTTKPVVKDNDVVVPMQGHRR